MKNKLDEFKGFKEFQNKLRRKKALKKDLSEGKTAQEILGFSNETMARFYRAAYHLFEDKRFADAANAFLFLTTLNPFNHDFWLGLGMATQLCKNFEIAIDAYEMAAICELDNPVSYFYLAKCLYAIHERENALHALDLALEYAQDKDEYAELKQQAQMARESLLRQVESG